MGYQLKINQKPYYANHEKLPDLTVNWMFYRL